jgi:hypothetical protein
MDSLGSEKIAKREDSSIDPTRNDTRGTIEFLGLSELRIADQTCLEPTFLTSWNAAVPARRTTSIRILSLRAAKPEAIPAMGIGMQEVNQLAVFA